MQKDNKILDDLALAAFQEQLSKMNVNLELTNNSNQHSKDPLHTQSDRSVQVMQVSLAEERAWMLHQKNPLSAAGPFSMAIKLTGRVDIQKLILAIYSIYSNDSNLNYSYHLNNEGNIEKRHLPSDEITVDVVNFDNQHQAVNELLKRQSKPMDLSKHPAIQFVLMPITERLSKDESIIMGVVGHHILLDDSAWQPIFHALSYAYQGKSVQVNTSQDITRFSKNSLQESDFLIAEAYWQSIFTNGLIKTPFPSSLLSHGLTQQYSLPSTQDEFVKHQMPYTIMQDGWHSFINNIPNINADMVRRFRTTIDANKITRFSHQSKASISQTLIALFGHYMASMLHLNTIDVLIPVINTNDNTQLNQIAANSNVVPIRISLNKSINKDIHTNHYFDNVITQVRDQVLKAIENDIPIEQIISVTNSNRNQLPNILITQFQDASQYLDLPNIDIEVVNIPPLASDYAITFAFQVTSDKQLNLELTTNEIINPTVGGFLLDQFMQYLQAITTYQEPILPVFMSSSQAMAQDIVSIEEPKIEEELTKKNIPSTSVTVMSKDKESEISTEQSVVANTIISLFKEILGIEDVTMYDNFFDLGGHSLLATRLIGKLKTKHDIEISIVDFFNHPTVAELAEKVCCQSKHTSTRDVTEIQESFQHVVNSQSLYSDNLEGPLTLLQQSYMDIAEYGLNPMFNIPYAMRLSQDLNETILREAFLDIMQRHSALRMLFVVDKENEVDDKQRVLPMIALKNYEWFWSENQQKNRHYLEILEEEAATGFDLKTQLPLRVRMLRDDNQKQILSFTVYHSSFDEWSTAIMMQELISAYQARSQGKEPVWQNQPKQFLEYAIEQDQSKVLGQHLDYWINKLGKVEPAKPLFFKNISQEAVLDKQHSLEPDMTGSIVEFGFSRLILNGLNELASINRASLFHVVYASIALGLYYLGAGKKILIGTSMFAREDVDYQDTIGYFTNVVLHHINITEELSLEKLVAQVKDSILSGLEYSDVPFGIVENAVSTTEDLYDNLCEFYIQLHAKNMLNNVVELNNKDIHIELLEPKRNISKFGLHFELFENASNTTNDEALRAVISYRISHYDDTQIKLIKTTIKVLIEHIALLSKDKLEQHTVRSLRKQLSQFMTINMDD